jgi:hypothetical protein
MIWPHLGHIRDFGSGAGSGVRAVGMASLAVEVNDIGQCAHVAISFYVAFET